ncbi:porin [Flavobacteriaceae bacterium]|nr:porin [Flavobacteriaceae bacterium]
MNYRCLLLFFTLIFLTNSYSQESNEKPTFLEQLKIPINTRLDFRYLNYENNSDDLPDDARFQFSYFKIDVLGNVVENLNFRVRYSPVTSTIGTSGISNVIQLANLNYLTKNKRWYFELGKSFLKLGTVEEQYLGADVYSWSIIARNVEVYRTGFTSEYRFGNNQGIGFQILNGNLNENNAVQSLEYNLFWFGEIGEIGDAFFSATAIIGPNQNTTPYTLNGGVQWKLGSYRLDTDAAVMYNFRNFYPETLYYSFPVQLARVEGKWSPTFKYIYNIVNPLKEIEIDYRGEQVRLEQATLHTVSGGIQYFPIPQKNLRFHLVSSYSFDEDVVKYAPPIEDPGNTKIGYNAAFQIILGVRIDFDVLHGLRYR